MREEQDRYCERYVLPVIAEVRCRLGRADFQRIIAQARIASVAARHGPGVDEEQFQSYAEEAKANCPVSRALAGIPEIVLTAKLV